MLKLSHVQTWFLILIWFITKFDWIVHNLGFIPQIQILCIFKADTVFLLLQLYLQLSFFSCEPLTTPLQMAASDGISAELAAQHTTFNDLGLGRPSQVITFTLSPWFEQLFEPKNHLHHISRPLSLCMCHYGAPLSQLLGSIWAYMILHTLSWWTPWLVPSYSLTWTFTPAKLSSTGMSQVSLKNTWPII